MNQKKFFTYLILALSIGLMSMASYSEDNDDGRAGHNGSPHGSGREALAKCRLVVRESQEPASILQRGRPAQRGAHFHERAEDQVNQAGELTPPQPPATRLDCSSW